MALIATAILIFAILSSAGIGCLFFHHRVMSRHHDDATLSVIRLIAGIFVVMTSLVLGLMINSAKNRFDGINRDVHAFATDLVLLDRTLQLYGSDAADARRRLARYVERAADGKWTSRDPLLVSDKTSEELLNDVGNSLRSFSPADGEHLAVWNDARQEYSKIVELRWALLEQSEGSIPPPIVAMVVTWLLLVFASFGYRAPRNAIVIGSLLVAAALMSSTIYLILELDAPFSGAISVSPAPLQRVLAEMKRQP
ncbi:DUF4239 domain-containing protein [Caballeronia sp. dw_276]|jgi:hypothetical protein|uniref:bestrophin-like domain n=1 Tax=Caballeronia sp. dw_276 TaxID=2719795 RepID=UPI001BD5990E|nr:DUF4239 domain-containing protein [Caballeronia sp. dw_276]